MIAFNDLFELYLNLPLLLEKAVLQERNLFYRN